MRRLVVAACLCLVWVGPAVTAAEAGPIDIGVGGEGTRFTVGGSKRTANERIRPSNRVRSPNTVTEVDYYLTLLDGPDGPCIGWTTNAADSLTSASAGAVLGLYDACPPTGEGEQIPPQVAAQVHVLRFWDSRPVPALEPEIDPGWAITGLRAYLETGADSAPATTLVFDTPVGRAELDIAADYVVDWGDGTPVESFAHEGGPWPDGGISHVYQHADPVTVTVAQNWGGAWRVTSGAAAGASGVLPELPVSAQMGLEVRQVQAVIQ